MTTESDELRGDARWISVNEQTIFSTEFLGEECAGLPDDPHTLDRLSARHRLATTVSELKAHLPPPDLQGVIVPEEGIQEKIIRHSILASRQLATQGSTTPSLPLASTARQGALLFLTPRLKVLSRLFRALQVCGVRVGAGLGQGGWLGGCFGSSGGEKAGPGPGAGGTGGEGRGEVLPQ